MFVVNAIVWPFQPEIFSFFGITLRWYGMLFAAAFVLGYYFTRKELLQENFSEKSIDLWLVYMLIGAILGARLGHCFFYEPEYFLSHPIEIFKTWNGGLASHGGAIGILIALGIYAWRQKINYLWTLDTIASVTALGGMFIRIGNLMNSEIIGKASDMPWAFIFPNVDQTPRHPAQLYEAIGYFLIFLFLRYLHKKYQKNEPNGFRISWFLVLVFGIRIFIEFFKEPQESFEANMFMNMGQWLSVPFVLIGSIILVFLYQKINKTKHV